MTTTLKALDGGTRSLTSADLAALDIALDGELLHPGDAGYDEARTLWNGMIDRHPGLVIRAAATARRPGGGELRPRQRRCSSAIRSGGHQIAGLAVADGALLLDLSLMRAVTVDPGDAHRAGRAGRLPRRRRRRDPGARARACRSASTPPPASPA